MRRSLTAMEDGLASLIPRESSYTIPGFIPSEVTLSPTLTLALMPVLTLTRTLTPNT